MKIRKKMKYHDGNDDTIVLKHHFFKPPLFSIILIFLLKMSVNDISPFLVNC